MRLHVATTFSMCVRIFCVNFTHKLYAFHLLLAFFPASTSWYMVPAKDELKTQATSTDRQTRIKYKSYKKTMAINHN